MVGEVIGNYRVVAELGKGGMGVVYRAEHVQLGRAAALKMLLPQFSSDAGIVQRFFNEARAASAIDHPGIVAIYDFGTHTDGRAYIAMEMLKGESLEHRLQRGPLSPTDGATILAQTAAALGAAHARGIVHRDLKPDNIFLTPNELVPGGIQVKLLDFGIAKLADEKTAGFKTQTGALMGTPAYMSPEQCMGKADLDHRTDIYSLGCILFHVLCGRPPFMSDQGTGMMIAAHLRDAAPDPRTFNPAVPAPLAAIALRCLEKEPAARFQSAAELRNALVAAGANAPLSKPPGASAAEQYMETLAPGLVPSHAPIATAPTTHAQSAAQVMTAPPPAKGKSRAPLVAGLVVVAAVAGVGAFVALKKNDTKSAAPTTEQTMPEVGKTEDKPKDTIGAKPAGTIEEAPKTPPEAEKPLVETEKPNPAVRVPERAVPPIACPTGQTTTVDTNGHCCWPDQAWSSSKNSCIGKPRCPDGMRGKGEGCVEEKQIATSTPQPIHNTAPSAGVPMFKLGAATYGPGDAVEIKFASPVSSKDNDRAWVTIIEAGKPPTAYGAWEYVKDGATTAKLEAPKTPGPYEVRIHTDYPTKSTNVRWSVAFTVGEPPPKADPVATPLAKQRFRLDANDVPSGAKVTLQFPVAMKALPGEQFWVTVVEANKDASAYGHYDYVPDGAKTMTIELPSAPGEYEVRLHANYPTKSTNVVHRVHLRIEPAP